MPIRVRTVFQPWHTMESIHGLTPASLQRNTEEKMFIAKIMQHIRDYIRAVQKYGKNFHKIPVISEDSPYVGIKAIDLKARDKAKTLYDGRIAYHYFFDNDDNEFGFDPVCELLDFNAAVFRRKLRNLTKPGAKAIYTMLLRGDAKIKHKQTMEKRNERRI